MEVISLKKKNLWAPWRIGYIQGLADKNECFICKNIKTPQDDDKNLVLWRSKNCIAVMNRFPYNNGHLLIAPVRHIPDFSEANDEELLEMTKLTRDAQKVLSLAIKPHGFNIGINFGRCAARDCPTICTSTLSLAGMAILISSGFAAIHTSSARVSRSFLRY